MSVESGLYAVEESPHLGFLRMESEGLVVRVQWPRDGGAPETFLNDAAIAALPDEIRALFEKGVPT